MSGTELLLIGGRSGVNVLASDVHAQRSAGAARRLEERAGAHMHRVATDDRPVEQIAADLARLWLGDALPEEEPR